MDGHKIKLMHMNVPCPFQALLIFYNVRQDVAHKPDMYEVHSHRSTKLGFMCMHVWLLFLGLEAQAGEPVHRT